MKGNPGQLKEEMECMVHQMQHSLFLLGCDVEYQEKFLDNDFYDVNELAEQLCDYYEPDKPRRFWEILSPQQLHAVDAVYHAFPPWDDETLWDLPALRCEAWSRVRVLARNALETFGFAWHSGILVDLRKSWPRPEIIEGNLPLRRSAL